MPRLRTCAWVAQVAVPALAAVLACSGCARPLARDASPVRACVDGDCDELQSQCDAGDPNGCVTLGAIHSGARAYDARCEAPLLRGCHLNTSACSVSLVIAATAACKGDHAAETRLARAACNEGYPPACKLLADKLLAGVDVPLDEPRAAELYAFACDVEDHFPDFAARDAGGNLRHYEDPMTAQVSACVALEKLTALGMAHGPSTSHVSPEHAVQLELARMVAYRDRRDFALRRPIDRWLIEERNAVAWFALPAEARAARVRAERAELVVPACGPITGAPAIR